MSFDELKTDEPYSGGGEPPPDLERQMLGGCSSFVIVSLMTYVLLVWPFFIVREIYEFDRLLTALAIGLLPSIGVGLFAIRRTGLPAFGGLMGGAASGAVFLNLRIDQVMLGLTIDEIPRPDYPPSYKWIVPGVVLGVCLVAGLLALPKEPDHSEN